MSSYAFPSSQYASGILANLAADHDGAFIGTGIIVGSSDNTAIYGAKSYHVVDVRGDVVGDVSGVQLGDNSFVDHDQRLKLGAGAGLEGYEGNGATINGYHSRATNIGSIYGALDGISMAGTSPVGQPTTSSLVNKGTIEGERSGVSHFGGEALILTNTGTITGGVNSFYDDFDSAATIINTGTMTGAIDLGNGADTYDGRGGHLQGAVFGGAGQDALFGGADDDKLDGGSGYDLMAGGKGDDTYFVDAVGDKVVEREGQGTDTVCSSFSFSLSGAYVENLTLTGSGTVAATGNGLANTITGNAAANVLKGGAGNDTFLFNTALGNGNVDTITDFSHAGGNNDTFHLDHAVFADLAAGMLNANVLKEIASGASTAGVDGDDRILYDKAHGDLYFDRDGAGAVFERVQFAHITANTALNHLDFIVV